MKSRTSFFNATVLKKDITRFAPVWGLYTVFLAILFLTSQSAEAVLAAGNIRDLMSSMTIVNLLYGGLCANILFGDLFQSRMCNALHAMPVRREGWFLTHVTAGALFCVVPNIAGTLFLMVLLQEYYYIALLWLAVTVLQFLFFFGLGVFSVMCAGNRLGMAAVYMIINFFSVLVYVLAKEVYEPLLFGFEIVSDPFLFFCPVYYLSDHGFFAFNYDYYNGKFMNGRIEQFFPEIWWYAATVAVIGAVLIGLAVLLYRKRKLECAGDFLALRVLEPVFLVIYTLACGVFLYALSSIFGFAADYYLMGIGVVVGFFTGQMLLKRTVRVFQVRSFIGFAVLAVVLVASLIVTKIDPLGITWYAPEVGEIAFMRVYRDSERAIYNNTDNDCYQLESPEEIAAFRQVHTLLMAEREEKTDGASHIYMLYGRKDGSQVKRYYAIDEKTAAYDTLRKYFSDYRYIFNVADWNTVKESITGIDVSLTGYHLEETADAPAAYSIETQQITEPKKIAQFLEAVRKDCEAGNMAQAYTFHTEEEYLGWCYLSSNVRTEDGTIIDNGSIFQDLNIYPSALNTKAVLDQWVEEYRAQ